MNENKITKKYLENFFKICEEIKYDGEFISLYEINNIINTKFQDLYKILNTKEKEIKKINNKNTNFIRKNIKKEKLNSINFNTHKKENYQEISFIFNYHDRIYCTNCISFYKIPQSNKIFYSGLINKHEEKIIRFLKENIKYISNVLYIMEYYYNEYNIFFDWYGIKVDNMEQTFNYDIFKIFFNLNQENPITIKMTNEEFKNLSITEESLSYLSYRDFNDFLKRIPIKIDELNPLYKNIINSSLEKKKIKQLKK